MNLPSSVCKHLLAFSAVMLIGLAGHSASAAVNHPADTALVSSKLIASPAKATVILPDKAFEKGNSQRFPTVYILNGFGGDYRDYGARVPELHRLASLYGMIFVMPDGRNSWYFDSPMPGGQQMESYITRELIPYIDANYPTLPRAGSRAITGLSMGGHGALYLAMRHPELFSAAGSMSGGVNIMPFADRWAIKQALGTQDENRQRWLDNTVINIADTITPGRLSITFDCGTDDFFYGVNKDLHRKLLERGIPHDFTSRPGNHSWPYWRNSIKYHLLFFNDRLRRD